MEYILKVIGARSLRTLVSIFLKIAKPPHEALPTPAAHITLEKIVDSNKKGKIGRQIPIDVYLPTKKENVSDGRRLPVVINMHGSGFMLNTFGDDAPFCQLVADQVGAIVLDVDYGKAPEAPYPSADEDVDSIVEWVVEKSELERKLQEYNVQIASDRMAVTGFSSGGKLALTACVRAKESARLDRIKAVVAFYPSTNLAESPYEKPQLKPSKGQAGSVVPPFLRQFLYSCYIPHTQSTPRSAPTVSPINAAADCFPQSVTIITCEGDSLAREAQQLAVKIRRKRGSGNTEAVQKETATDGVLWWEAEGQGHAWDKECKQDSESARKRDYAYALTVDRLNAALH